MLFIYLLIHSFIHEEGGGYHRRMSKQKGKPDFLIIASYFKLPTIK